LARENISTETLGIDFIVHDKAKRNNKTVGGKTNV